MPTSAEQLHHGRFEAEATSKGDEVRLFVDLDVCASGECESCDLECSYFYHVDNNGIASVAELATYALVCRNCEEPHCVAACPKDALEQQEEKGKMLVRHNMRCVSCRSCSHACPYGTIYPEHVPQLAHICDFCLDRRDAENEPACIRSCPHGALALRRADEELDENIFLVGENLMVRSTHWMREKA
jgi:Fe-S-cluster-containing dehydrogenase component